MDVESSNSGWMKLSELPLSMSALAFKPSIKTKVIDLTSDCGAAAETVVSVGAADVPFVMDGPRQTF